MNAVYLIECNDCDSVYVGTTRRKLNTRVNEHKNALFKPYINSNVAEHCFSTKHSVNFQEPKVNYIENKLGARKFLEKFQIEKCKQANIPLMNDRINSHTNLPQIYLTLFNPSTSNTTDQMTGS